ncbi:hypothetical protein BGX34_008474 [Mortierella sp. NVP85]|nr:hypothetical protein BGX34_008474 [Mortierella sp. NVP85]
MSSVPTIAPPETPQLDPPARIFGLRDAPCFYPTAEEFMEPLKFIESIRPEAEKAGICKIIPPESWKPTFALDTETFRFKTRIQKLNSMEGQTMTNLNYLDQLAKFHRQQGHPVQKIPQLDKRPIDLFRLRKEVAARGGYQKVTSGKKWAEIGRELDYTRKQCTSLSNALKTTYFKVILPYDIYLLKQGKTHEHTQQQDIKRELSADLHPNRAAESQHDATSASPSTSTSTSTSISTSTSSLLPETRKSKRIKKDPVSYHIPKTDWYCSKCLVAGDDYGFEEGQEHSLNSFQQRCNTFKKTWFEKAGYADGQVPEDVVEREFWRLVENAHENVEVEYGTDLHSTLHGSGFPTLERHPIDKYSTHPANLNNIPFLPESLFCHIKTDILGMMVPWLHVGMCFSTFCWHNEDHYAYSIDYMHWGETRTWYGVPASDALKFEDTMRKAVPELFEQQPDLLFHLKAVNFAPPDWCYHGLECVQRYKDYRKQPVFSHDELIMTTALNDTSIATAHWLQEDMKSLLDRELSDRKNVLNQVPGIRTVIEEVDRPEEEVHPSERFLRLRYSDEQLKEITQRVIENAGIPDIWTDKYRKIMMETRTPSLKLLRSLLAEADRIPFPIKEAGRLRKFVNVANEWVEAATKVLVRKHHQGRRLVDRAQGSNGKRLEELQEMLRQVERLRFDCPEIRQLEESIEIMLDFQMDARRALKKPEHDVAECRELYEYGLSMNIVMDEIDQLEVIVTDLTWAERVSSKGVLQEDFLLICNFVDDAEKNGVSSSNPLLMEMIKKREAGLLWEEKAQEVLSKNPIDLDELRAVIEDGRSFPVPRNVLSKAEQLHSKALELKKTADQLAKRSREPKYGNRPSVLDLKRLLKTADSMPIDIEHKEMLEQESKKFDDWLTACQQLLLSPTSKKQAGMELEGALDDLKQNVEACTAEEKAPLPVVSSNGVHRVNTVPAPGNKPTETVNEDNGSSPDSNTITKHASNDQEPATADSGTESLSSGAKKDKAVDVTEMTTPPIADTPMEESLKMDISDDVERDEQIYCLCRSSESGMMVECDECHEWYHGPCVRVTKREATTKSNYICPVCNLSLVIKRDKPRPTLEELVKMSELAQSLLFFTPEVPLLESIVHTVMEFQKKVDQFLKHDIITEKDVLQVKAFLRKIEGLDIELAGEREVLRAHVLRLCPSSMPVPGVMLSTYPSAPPLSTIVSTCLCTQRSAATPQTELVSPQMELTPSPLEQPTPPLGPPISPLEPAAPSMEPQDMGEVMIQCGICSDWLHIHCAGLDVEQVQKLSKFVCPVCCLVKKKPYTYGQAANPAEAQARASERMQANKDTTKQRRQKLSKDSIDLTGLVTGTEEKKKRPYKKREHSETGDKPKKRRKSSGGQSTVSTGSTDSNATTPQVMTTLPSFSEGFLLHDRAPIKSPVESHHLNRPSHALPYSPPPPPSGHPIHAQPHYHGPSNPPAQQQRYTSHPNGALIININININIHIHTSTTATATITITITITITAREV